MNNRVYLVLPVGKATVAVLRKAVHSDGHMRLSLDGTKAVLKFSNPERKDLAAVTLPTSLSARSRLTHTQAKALMGTADWTAPASKP